MLLLYPGQPEMTVRLWWIYIPLCFYFIARVCDGQMAGSTFTFHYASTLSSRLSGSISILIIYIPLCFYFIRGSSHMTQTSYLNLHSTMLLLYLKSALKIATSVAYLHSTMLLLYLTVRVSHPFQFLHLHSTMLLLYRFTLPGREGYLLLIYIPLCFYFIHLCISRR